LTVSHVYYIVNKMNASRLTVFFDGLCHLCSREIDHYRKVAGSDQIQFVDITSADFSASHHGVDPRRVHKHMHVRRTDGSLAVGVDAFIAIWEALPRYRFAARWAKVSVVHALLTAGYGVFAELRPYLPKKKADCSSSPYCETNMGSKK